MNDNNTEVNGNNSIGYSPELTQFPTDTRSRANLKEPLPDDEQIEVEQNKQLLPVEQTNSKEADNGSEVLFRLIRRITTSDSAVQNDLLDTLKGKSDQEILEYAQQSAQAFDRKAQEIVNTPVTRLSDIRQDQIQLATKETPRKWYSKLLGLGKKAA